MASAPRICSVTLHHRTDEIPLDALRSVAPHVDGCVVLDTHPTPYPFRLERALCKERGIPLHVAKSEQTTRHDQTATRRNQGLEAAAAFGYDWALVIDTDERLVALPGADLHRQLAETELDCLQIWDTRGVYPKDKIFYLPQKGKWVREVHEHWASDTGAVGILDGFRFWELPRSPETARARLIGIRDALREVVAGAREDDPHHARNWYYLGDALISLGDGDEAIQHFVRAGNTSKWDEEAAWSFFRAGLIFASRKQWDDAFALGLLGHGKHAGLADITAFLAQVSLSMGNAQQAIYWGEMALVHSAATGGHRNVRRVIFTAPPFLWEGPHIVLAGAYAARDAPGDDALSEYHKGKAEQVFQSRVGMEQEGTCEIG